MSGKKQGLPAFWLQLAANTLPAWPAHYGNSGVKPTYHKD